VRRLSAELTGWRGKAASVQSGRLRSRAPLAVSLVCVILFAWPVAAQDWDQEFWLDQRFSFSLSPVVFARIRFLQGANDHVSRLFNTFFEANVGFHVRPWLTLMPGFRHDRLNPFGRMPSHENRPQFAAIFQTQWGCWRPNLRFQVEGRFLPNESGFLRFLPQPGVEYALSSYKDRPVVFYLTNEFAFDSRTDRYSRNRFQLGISLPATPTFSIVPTYMIESIRSPGLWDHDNVWGLSFWWRL
jgi:hypothetical protein